MTHAQHQEPSTPPSGAWAGWVTFAAVIVTLLDILVTFVLTARWDEARAAM